MLAPPKPHQPSPIIPTSTRADPARLAAFLRKYKPPPYPPAPRPRGGGPAARPLKIQKPRPPTPLTVSFVSLSPRTGAQRVGADGGPSGRLSAARACRKAFSFGVRAKPRRRGGTRGFTQRTQREVEGAEGGRGCGVMPGTSVGPELVEWLHVPAVREK